MTKKDKPLPPLPDVLPWEQTQDKKHWNKIGIFLFVVLAFGIGIGFNIGIQGHDPPVTTTVTNHHNSNSTLPAPPTSNGNNANWSVTPTNTSDPHSPPAPSPQATLTYGMVNMGLNANMSAVTWIEFNGTSGVFTTTMTLQWNAWKTNYWFDYSTILLSNVTYVVTVHQANHVWATVQGSITPSGANDNANFNATGP